MVLKEAFCAECGRERDVFCKMDQTEVEAECLTCECVRTFRSKCTGGVRKRWRYVDWDGYNPRGCIETLETKVTHNDTGEDGRQPFSSSDGQAALAHKYEGTVNNWHRNHRDEREDRFRFNFNKKRDRVSKQFDMKQK